MRGQLFWVALAASALGISACKGDPGPATQGTPGNNGPPGADGKAGPGALVRTSTEPAGMHCAAGGTRVDFGVDKSGDGTLEPAEITGTSYVCATPSGAVGGNVVISKPGDADLVAGVTSIQGDLIVMPNYDTSTIAVPLGEVDLSRIKSVSGDVRIESNPGLTGIHLDGLVTVGGSLFLDDDPQVSTFNVSSLVDVGGEFFISETPHMHFLYLSAITNVGGDYVANTGSRPIAGAVLRLNVPVNVGGDAMLSEMGGLTIVLIDGSLSVGGDFTFHHNVDLQFLMATGQLSAGHDVYVTSNISLTTAAAEAFAAQIHHPGENFISDNAP